MSNPYQDPVVEMLREISAKQDLTIAKQEAMDKRLSEIQTDCQRIARTNGSLAGAVSGAVSGGVVATGIAFIRAKFGF
ncbi:hypothetical protein [Neisseria elongata]|uniref:hypothetical protein n=1 Tax=Neisseria elongata TaxID=495 RepID=UPI000668A016|nr:hypothetical protein [Neisseria elongata]DAK36017.1 MAG TPA: Tetrahydromethanopterin S-methyltransferase, F subunit (MtrF) [Caudoviricetes sp.]